MLCVLKKICLLWTGPGLTRQVWDSLGKSEQSVTPVTAPLLGLLWDLRKCRQRG